MKKIEALISDADGTLVDTVSLIRRGQYETAKKYLIEHGLLESDIPSYESFEKHLNEVVGGSARETLEKTVKLLFESTPDHLDSINYDHLHEMLNPIQDELANSTVESYEGLESFLQWLGSSGIKLAIFTSGTPHHVVRNFGISLPRLRLAELYKDKTKTDIEKLTEFTEKLKKDFVIPEFAIVTADDTIKHKPDPESLNLAMKRLGVLPESVAVLGDHTVDMQTATNAGVEVRIGITHGFADSETLRANGAKYLAHSLADVRKVIELYQVAEV